MNDIASSLILGIRFGENAESVHQKLGPPQHQFRRTQGSGRTDMYTDRGAMLTYNEEGLLDYVEIVPPANPHWHSIELLGRPFVKVVRDLQAAGLNGQPYDSGLDYLQIGMRLYTSHPDEPELPVESIGLYPVPTR